MSALSAMREGTSSAKRPRPVNKCVRCRRMKVKCDIDLSGGKSCTRCVQGGASCVEWSSTMEAEEATPAPGGTVTSKQRVAELVAEVARLKRELAISQATPPPAQLPPVMPATFDLATPRTVQSLIPEEFPLTTEQTDSLVTHFLATVTISFPLLSPHIRDSTHIRPYSMLLLYTITTIASRSHVIRLWWPTLPEELLEHTLQLVGQLTVNAFRPASTFHVYDIEALLLLAAWPPAPRETDGFAHRRLGWSFLMLGQAIRLGEALGIFTPLPDDDPRQMEYARCAIGASNLDGLFSMALDRLPTLNHIRASHKIILDFERRGESRDQYFLAFHSMQDVNKRVQLDFSARDFPISQSATLAGMMRLHEVAYVALHEKILAQFGPKDHGNAFAFVFQYSQACFYSKAIPTYMAAAEKGNVEAMNDLGVFVANCLGACTANQRLAIAFPEHQHYQYAHDVVYFSASFPTLLALYMLHEPPLRKLMDAPRTIDLSAKVAAKLRALSRNPGDVAATLAAYITSVQASMSSPLAIQDRQKPFSTTALCSASKELIMQQEQQQLYEILDQIEAPSYGIPTSTTGEDSSGNAGTHFELDSLWSLETFNTGSIWDL